MPPLNTTLGVRIILDDNYQMRLAETAQKIPRGNAKAIMHLTRKGKIAFHFLKGSCSNDQLSAYFSQGKFKLTDSWLLPTRIAQNLGLTNQPYQLQAGRYHAIDLGNHITVVIPISPQPVEENKVGIL